MEEIAYLLVPLATMERRQRQALHYGDWEAVSRLEGEINSIEALIAHRFDAAIAESGY